MPDPSLHPMHPIGMQGMHGTSLGSGPCPCEACEACPCKAFCLGRLYKPHRRQRASLTNLVMRSGTSLYLILLRCKAFSVNGSALGWAGPVKQGIGLRAGRGFKGKKLINQIERFSNMIHNTVHRPVVLTLPVCLQCDRAQRYLAFR